MAHNQQVINLEQHKSAKIEHDRQFNGFRPLRDSVHVLDALASLKPAKPTPVNVRDEENGISHH
jgi:hypothetical protein